MGHSSARCPLGAGFLVADRLTGLAGEVAGLVVAAVGVGATLNIDTCNERVALQPGGTDAPRLVGLGQALCSSATRPVGVQARVHTVFVNASLVRRAVIVHSTLRSVTLAVGVSSVALGASTDRVVNSGCALGLGCAGVLHDARVDAIFVDAGLVHGTL